MATNPFNIVPAKKTSPFNIPPAKPSVAGILDRALTGGFVSKTLSVADRFAKLSPEEKKKLLETGSDIQTNAPLKPEVLQKNIELKEATQKAAAKKFFDFEKSPLSISAAPTELIEAQKSPEAAAAYEKEQTRRRLQYVRQNEGYFPAVGEALKQYGQAKVEAMQPVLELADTAANKVEEQGRPILGGAVRGAKGLYQSSVGATGEAARQLGEGNVGGAAFTYGLGKLMNSSPTGMAWTAVMEQKPVKEYVQPVLDAWNNELDTFFADQKNNPFSPIGSVLKESGKLLPYLLFDKVSRIPFKSKKTITLQDGKTFEVPTDRKWYAEAKKSVFNDILQLANDPAKFFKEKQFGLSIRAVGDEAEKGKMTSLKDMRTKLPRAGIEKPAPLPKISNEKIDPLIEEAKKYKSAEEFVKAQGTRTGVEVRDKIGTKLQDPYTAEYLPTNSDGTITLYHSTTKEGAEKIKQSGIFGSKTEGGDIYFTTNKKGYGGIGKDKDVVLAFNVDPKKIKFDDVYRGELHLKGNNTDIGGIKPVVIKTKSQLTEIWNKANKNVDIEPLLQEAKKYKSAEEFVKAQGTPVYHGGKLESIDDITDFYEGARNTERYDPITNLGVNFGDKNTGQYFADRGGGSLLEAYFSPKKPKVFKTYKELLNKIGEYDENLSSQIKSIRDINKKNEFMIDNQFDPTKVNQFKEDLIEQGFDAVKFTNEMDGGITYIPLKKEALKTKSQLTDIWNQSQKGESFAGGDKSPFVFKEKPREGGISEEARARADLQRAGELRGNSPYSSIPQGRENIGGIEKVSLQPQEIGRVGVEPVQLQRDPKVLNTPQSQDVLPVQSQLGNVSDGALGTTIPTKQTLVNKVAELDAVKNEFDNLTEEIRAPIEAEIYNELAHSKAGERYQLPDGTFTGMASTFPKWIPYGDLRTSDLVQKVMKSMFSGKELKGKAGQLQEIVLAEIEKRMKPHELYSYYSEMRDYVKKLQTETAQEFRAGVGDIGNAEQLPFGVEGLEGAPPSAPTPGMLNLAKDVLKYKDISGFYGQMRDVYRNFKKVFGDRFAAVKREILDPFDSAKGMFIDDQKRLLEDLDRVIVKELGIRKGSKESAAVMDYGEKLISFTDLEKYFGTAKAEKIVAADRWFRNKYNELIDEVNNVRTRIYPGNPDKLVPKRQDYYRHFQELPQTLLGIRSIFEDPVAISPSLSGISEFTQPKTKWAGFMQKRKGNASVRDAVGGFLDYVPTATYAKWIDPQIAKFRGLAKTLAAATEDTKNLNNFIEFLQDFSNDLAGKTNAADRYIQKSIPGGRTTFRFIDFLNKKIKANAVLGNASSAIAQLFNIPQGIATAKQHSLKGMARTLGQIFHENKPMMESSFLKERYARSLFDKFETRYLAKAKNFAAWFTGVGDEIGTKFIWNSQYEKALAEGIANPVKYADDITRELVAGRGVGEVPLAQKSKLFQLVAPFQLEVTNLWYVMGDMVSKKDFAALATLFAANFLMNRAAEQIRGNPVVFDPIEATIEGVQRLKGERDWKVGTGKLVGRLAGEVLSNIPFGSDFSKYIIPENSRADFFGEADPTRFGQGLIPKVIQGGRSEIPMLLLPFGGAQLKKTYGTVKALMNNGQVKSSSGKTTNFSIRNKSIPNITKGLLFGQYATEEGQKYLNRNKRTKSLFNIPSASGNNPFKLQSDNTSGNPFVLPKAR